MRTDQYIGLPQAALNFLGQYEKQGPICPACKRCTAPTLEVIGHITGMFGGDIPLHRHTLIKGYADEYLQASPCSSGPMFFIGLRIHKANGDLLVSIEWQQSEIDAML